MQPEFTGPEETEDFYAVNDDDAYAETWEVDDPNVYVNPPEIGGGGGGDPHQNRGSVTPLTVLARNNGNVTVQTNKTLTFNSNIPFKGKVSGSIPAGARFTARDSNRNGIPDLLEGCLKKTTCVFGE